MKEISLVNPIKILVKWRKFIYLNIFVIAILAILLALILPSEYQVVAIIAPSWKDITLFTSEENGEFLSTKENVMPLTPIFADIYGAILKSKTLQKNVIEENELLKVYDVSNLEDAVRILQRHIEIRVTPEGLIEIVSKDRDRILAMQIAESFIKNLDDYNKQTFKGEGRDLRIYYEEKLRKIKKELAILEDSLRRFREKNRTFLTSEEIQQAFETYSELKTQSLIKEVELEVRLESATSRDLEVVRLQRELIELNKKIKMLEQEGLEYGFGAGYFIPFSGLPKVTTEQTNIKRDIGLKIELYRNIMIEYEKAKILENRELPTIQIIQEPFLPDRGIWPKRGQFILGLILLSLNLSIWLSFLLNYIHKNTRSY